MSTCRVDVCLRAVSACVTMCAAVRGWICLFPHSLLCFSGQAVPMGPLGYAAAALVAAGDHDECCRAAQLLCQRKRAAHLICA